jgi:D-alanine transaminase/branched-chain amino acid aminotransferase
MPESGIKLTLTGGDSSDGFSLGEPNLIITQSLLPSYQAMGNSTGIKIVTYQHQRQMPGVKSIDYLMAVWLQPYIKEQNAQDVLYHSNNLITECPRANIFIVTKQDEVLTPAINILHGIIRSKVLGLNAPFAIAEAPVTLDDVYNAKEIFVTSTTKNILPVVQVDSHVVGDGSPGKITQKIAESLLMIINKNPVTSYNAVN